MSKRRYLAGAVGLAALALASVFAVRIWADLDHAHELGKKLKCTCNGCEQTAGTCYHVGGAFSGPCGTAKTMLAEIQALLDKGLSDDKVMEAMIKEYGPSAYVEPPKRGFGLVAWLMPVFYLFGGAVLVVFVIGRWRRRPHPNAAVAAANSPASQQALERARALAQKATED